MPRKKVQLTGYKGMNQDLSISKFSPEYSFENFNICIDSNESNSMFTITNENGNIEAILYSDNLTGDSTSSMQVSILGDIIGKCILNDWLVIFTKSSSNYDYIYRIRKDSTWNSSSSVFTLRVYSLFYGNLGFSKDNFIEAIGVYETENIQKVYWVDGINQPRFINLVPEAAYDFSDTKQFDFSRDMKLQESVTITKNNSSGQFHSGVIQYAFSYWNKYGVETNIFYHTPLYYVSHVDRAGSADEICSNSFNINVTYIDTQFQYLRVYCILRTSLNSQPSCRIIGDFLVPKLGTNTLNIIDNGIIGSNFDINSLNFIGGQRITAKTMAIKDNTLFFGNIKYLEPSVLNIQNNVINKVYSIETPSLFQKILPVPYPETHTSFYVYSPVSLNYSSQKCKSFKFKEYYRFGIQAQYKNGNWSDPIQIIDKYQITSAPYIVEYSGSNRRIEYNTYGVQVVIPTSLCNDLKALGYINIRPVYVPLTSSNRTIISQGYVTGTIFKIMERNSNTPYSIGDYFIRPTSEFYSSFGKDSIFANDINYTNNSIFFVGDRVCTPFAPLSSKGNEDWWLYTPKCSGAIKNLLNNSNYTDKFYAHYYSYSEINFNLVVGFGNYAATDIRDRGNNTIINKNNNFYLSYWRDIAQSKPTDGNTNGDSWKYWFRYNYLIDRNICNFWSPDVEFDQLGSSIESIENIDFVGVAWIYKSYYSQSYNMKGWGTFYGSYTDNLGRAMWLKAVTKENFNIGVHDVKHTGNIDDDNTRISHIYESYFDSNISNYISFGSSSNYKIVKPKYIKNDIKATSYSCDSRLGEESILYNQLYDVTLVHSSLNYAGLMQYKLNSHLLFQLKQNSKYTSTQTGRLSLIPEFTYDNESTIDYNLWYSSVTYVCDLIKRSLVSGSRSYMWIADLVREVKNQYCDVNISNLSTQNWVPCGDRVALSSKAITVKFEEGDTFFQKYDCFRVSNIGNDVELNWQKIYEGFSLNLESYINLDGRWDSHRYEVGLSTSTFETFNKNNPVYSQLNNFFNYTAAGLQFNNSDSMPTTFIWSKPKVYGDQTDKSTGLWLTNSYTVDGIYGTINSIIKYNDELYGFQNSALFQINYNSRVQLSASDGVPIELGQSGKVSGVRYVSNTKGTTNKWSIVESIGGLFFIDGQYKDLCVFNSNGVTSISDKMSFKTWSRNNIYDYGEYGYNNINAFVSDSDLINDYVYFVNGNKCLKLNERMQCFESFVSHENTPFMFTCFDEFLSIRKNYNNLGNNKIWINYKGKKNIFYGSYVNSSITFFVNPDPANDKVFDNIQYRCDFYDQNGTYLPSKTFDSIYIQNEFQTSFFLPNSIVGNVFSNKKFRLWSFPFPRQTGTLNRIRNPWIKLSFNLTTNNDSSKIFFHDLFITYTI